MKNYLVAWILLVFLNTVISQNPSGANPSTEKVNTQKVPGGSEVKAKNAQETKFNDSDRQKKSFSGMQTGSPIYGDPVPLKVNLPNQYQNNQQTAPNEAVKPDPSQPAKELENKQNPHEQIRKPIQQYVQQLPAQQLRPPKPSYYPPNQISYPYEQYGYNSPIMERPYNQLYNHPLIDIFELPKPTRPYRYRPVKMHPRPQMYQPMSPSLVYDHAPVSYYNTARPEMKLGYGSVPQNMPSFQIPERPTLLIDQPMVNNYDGTELYGKLLADYSEFYPRYVYPPSTYCNSATGECRNNVQFNGCPNGGHQFGVSY